MMPDKNWTRKSSNAVTKPLRACSSLEMNSHIEPNSFIAIRPSSGLHKIVKIVPDTSISLGKYGSVGTNSLLGRPFYLTFEILDKRASEAHAKIRIVPAQELHAEALAESLSSEEPTLDIRDEDASTVSTPDKVDSLMRNNRLTVDDPARQVLSMDEIEDLKKAGKDSGKEVIAKIMESHSALGEKSAFSLAKYTLRKTKKYMRRFTVLPLDVSMLASWMLHEKEPARIMELRQEMLGLIASWSNAHFNIELPLPEESKGRWLVVDDTGGLIVALLAERMGILYPQAECDARSSDGEAVLDTHADEDEGVESLNDHEDDSQAEANHIRSSGENRSKRRRHAPDAMSADTNTITLIHPATQPNISILSYFSYNPTENATSTQVVASDHPLHCRLKTLTWLQLLRPDIDLACTEPEKYPESEVATWKAGKRSSYHRKRRRWTNLMRVVEETRAGGFDGLVVASAMDSLSILNHTVPLLRGGAPIAVYHANIEPLAEVMDAYSTTRKTAYINLQSRIASDTGSEEDMQQLEQDFLVDPRFLLAPSLQTVRAREWQVLPGRTHPMMTSRGGAESYLFTATKVIPASTVEARGRYTKKRKVDDGVFRESQTPEQVATNGI